MPLKIVHCADLHIGASFSHIPSDLAAMRGEEIRGAFLNIVNYCKEKAVDALLICGDLFDCANPSRRDCEFVRNTLATLSPIPVYIICGNHDYMCNESPFAKEEYFSENVHIFPCFDHSFEIPGKGVVIWGKSYNSGVTEPTFARLNPDENKINIMCIHGDTVESSDYNAISRETLSSFPCNYAAFGHIHNGEIFEIDGVKCAYCGTPEGHGFSDDGFTGFIYAEITPQETKLTPVSYTKRRYVNITVDVSGKSNLQIIKDVSGLVNATDFFRLTLIGEFTEDISIPIIKEELTKVTYYIDLCDSTTAGYDFDSIENEESLRGEFLRELRKICNGEEEFLLSAKAGLDALSGIVPCMEAEI